MQLYSTYLVQDAGLMLAAAVVLFADLQLLDKTYLPSILVWSIAGAVVGGTADMFLSVTYWLEVMRVVTLTTIGNQFDNKDSLPALDRFYIDETEKFTKKKWFGRQVVKRAKSERWRASGTALIAFVATFALVILIMVAETLL
jgi:hypothetical protein